MVNIVGMRVTVCGSQAGIGCTCTKKKTICDVYLQVSSGTTSRLSVGGSAPVSITAKHWNTLIVF